MVLSFFFVLSISSAVFFFPGVVSAQDAPDSRDLFEEDRDKKKKRAKEKKARQKKKKKSAARKARDGGEAGDLPFDLNSATFRYDSAENTIYADGGLSIRHGSGFVEAESGKVNVETNEAEFEGNIVISEIGGTIAAERADIDLDTFTGGLEQCEIRLDEGDYIVAAERARKISEDTYTFDDASLTTCQCPDATDCRPWSLRADEAKITQEGYGQVWDAFLAVHDVPVLYVPYLIFPVKSERQSGFLPATFGNGRRSGFQLELPFFWAIDRSTDATITGILETEIRRGASLEFRKVLSREASLELGVTYLDERPRDGDLLGTDISGLDDPTFDEDRIAGYLDFAWQTEVGTLPLQFIADGNFVSDDLFLREFEDEKIGESNDRYVTSEAVLRSTILGYGVDLTAEYNQALVTDDDLVFQRAPELSAIGIHRFKPFGDNPYGLKFILNNRLEATNFQRSQGFDGLRAEAQETLRIPFHYRNYFDVELSAGVRGTIYELDETLLPDAEDDGTITDDERLPSSSDRVVPDFRAEISSSVERVFQLDSGNWFKQIADLGARGRSEELVRIKHTIEPTIKYRVVPSVDQSENPQFDSQDQLAQRNVVTYGITQRLYGRFDRRNEYLYGIEEVTPEVEDLGSLRQTEPLADEFGIGPRSKRDEQSKRFGLRRPKVRELARLELSQSYDVLEDRKDDDPDRTPLADLDADLRLFPNRYVRIRAGANYNVEEQDFSSYSIAGQLFDKRGDELRARFNFVDDSVRQLETGLELRVTENLKLGYYTRYDDLDGEFIETRGGMRYRSSCKCWYFDVTVTDKINPDETEFAFTVTLKGLGAFGNTFFQDREDRAS